MEASHSSGTTAIPPGQEHAAAVSVEFSQDSEDVGWESPREFHQNFSEFAWESQREFNQLPKILFGYQPQTSIIWNLECVAIVVTLLDICKQCFVMLILRISRNVRDVLNYY